MDMALADLIPLVVGAAMLPAWIIVVLFLLRDGGVRTAAAFVAGSVAVRLVQGALFGSVFGAPAEANGNQSGALIASTLLLVVGVLMLVTAVKQWHKAEDLDAPPPKWMETFRGLSAFKAFGLGALFVAISVKEWVFTLSALAVICQAPLNQAGSVLAYLLFVLASQSLLLAPIIVCAVAPAKSGRLLDAAQGLLNRNSRAIVIAVSTILGAWFLWKGITGLA